MESLRGRIDEQRYSDVLARLNIRRRTHCLARCRLNCLSDLPDNPMRTRMGIYPLASKRKPWSSKLLGRGRRSVENASGGKAIRMQAGARMHGFFSFYADAGRYEIDIQYFDQEIMAIDFWVLWGTSWMNGRQNDILPATKIGGDSSTRRRIRGLALRPGDEIRIVERSDKEEHAALDYVEIRFSRTEIIPYERGSGILVRDRSFELAQHLRGVSSFT